jgi:hypothetical protein
MTEEIRMCIELAVFIITAIVVFRRLCKAVENAIFGQLTYGVAEVYKANELTCVHPTCKRRCTGSKLLNDRLEKIGYEVWLREFGSRNKQAVEEANKEAAESDVMPNQDHLKEMRGRSAEPSQGEGAHERPGAHYIGELSEMGFTEAQAKEVKLITHDDAVYIIHKDFNPIRVNKDGLEFVDPSPEFKKKYLTNSQQLQWGNVPEEGLSQPPKEKDIE